MADKLIITFDEYNKIVEKLAIEIHKKYKPTVLVGIMRGAAPILDILSRILKLPIAYIVIQSYSGEGMEDKQGQLMFAREISSLAESKDYNKVLLVDDLSDTGLTLNKSIEWLKNYGPTKDFIKEVKTALRPTDLPWPVAPAVSKWGSLGRSAILVSVLIGLPKAKVSSISASW